MIKMIYFSYNFIYIIIASYLHILENDVFTRSAATFTYSSVFVKVPLMLQFSCSPIVSLGNFLSYHVLSEVKLCKRSEYVLKSITVFMISTSSYHYAKVSLNEKY